MSMDTTKKVKKKNHTEWEKIFVFSLFPIVLPKQVNPALSLSEGVPRSARPWESHTAGTSACPQQPGESESLPSSPGGPSLALRRP